MKMLLAYDGGEPAKRALDRAVELAKATGSTIDVVSVVPEPDGRSFSESADVREVHARQLQEARTLLDAEGLTCELIEPDGEVAETIERIAEDGAYDMVVVGSRGLGAFSSFFGGSVSEHVAAHAGPTVLIAR